MKKLFSLIILSAASLLPFQDIMAQSYRYANDALLFSQPGITGSARIRAMGGAQSSLGGDVSSIHSNPAGLGFFNRSEISFSPTYINSANDTRYLGEGSYGYGSNFNVSNFGIVLSGQKSNDEGWIRGNLGISYQRVNNFHNKFSYEGRNSTTGLIDLIIDNFETNTPDMLTDLAYSTYLVGDYWDENGDPISTFVYPPSSNNPYLQNETVTRTGGQNQFSISYGGNINDRFYIGGGIGFTSIDYRLEKRFNEIYAAGDPVASFSVYEDQRISGSGINATLGLIARPAEFVSIGLSYATPTFYTLEENFNTEVTSNYNNLILNQDNNEGHEGAPIQLNESFDYESSYYNFNLRTPGKLTVGSTFFFEKQGFITADVDFLNYSNNRFSDDLNGLSDDNQAIQNDFTSAVNVRLGGEYRYQIFRLRAGVAHIGDPYRDSDSWNRSMNVFSGGAGLKFQKYYIDLMVSQQRGDQFYYPYTFAPGSPFESPLVDIKNRLTTAMLTFGITF